MFLYFRKSTLVLAGVLFFSSLLTPKAQAFPFMVRHNYPNCISCHVSPTGGGVLNQYGRELSKAILSTWGGENEKESQFAEGLVPLPTFVDAMGLYRELYAYQATPFIQQGKWIYMQGDLEADVHIDKWVLDAAVGYQDPLNATTASDYMIARRFYLGYKPTEDTSVRVGRFFPAYGILTDNHFIPIKRDLGWDQDQETYNVEAAWISDRINIYATGIFGRPDQLAQHRETGGALTSSVAIEDHYKVGASYYYGNGQDEVRSLIGPWGILGFTPNLSLETELDFQHQSSMSGAFDPHWGAVNYQKLDYELIQGLHLYLTQDFSRLNFSDMNTLNNSFGTGVDWFPRPHFEFNLSYQKVHYVSVTPQYTDFAWLMLNIYI